MLTPLHSRWRGEQGEQQQQKQQQPPRDRSGLKNVIHVEPVSVKGPLSNEEDDSQHPRGCSLYGTRLSTVILVRRSGEVVFVERDIWTLDDDAGERDDDDDGGGGGGARLADAKSERTFKFSDCQMS